MPLVAVQKRLPAHDSELTTSEMKHNTNTLKLKRLHIDTQIEHVVYMRKDCVIYKSEGFESMSRVQVSANNKTIVASLNIINKGVLHEGEAGLSESAWKWLGAKDGDEASFSHPPQIESMKHVRAKMYRQKLQRSDFKEILNDIVSGSYSNVEISAFLTSCAGDNLDLEEVTGLTQSMVETGHRLEWNNTIIVDKHCVGGLPGNRTTPIVVAIVAEAGLIIPKTSSRAITSPAGTADTLETITHVDLDMQQIQEVINKENGCFAWGGSVKLIPADDILIRVERALDIDSAGQMIASVLSKKNAAGSTHVVIDVPVGKTAKVRTLEEAEKLKYFFNVVGAALNLKIKVLITDGSQPVGRGIGPALEAMDVLSVLRNEAEAPADLRERSLVLAAEILELSECCAKGEGLIRATNILNNGSAYKKFEAICRAQGAFKTPVPARYVSDVCSSSAGTVTEIDNRRLAKVAKLAGAPRAASAGVLLMQRRGNIIREGDLLYRIYAEEKGQLAYALRYVESQTNIIFIS